MILYNFFFNIRVLQKKKLLSPFKDIYDKSIED